jgi:kynurenine formamidase
MPSRLVDLSHTVSHGLVTYPGLPAPVVSDHLTREASRERYAAGTEFRMRRIEMLGNTGTYLDAPSHRFANGADLAGLPLESLADLPGALIAVPSGARRIGPAALPPKSLRGSAVLFRTGWSRHFGTPRYGEGHPFVSAELARELVRREVALVGIDSLNIDDTEDGARPAHTALLAAQIPIVEHLTNLEALPPTGFRFFAVPVKIAGLDSFPVRAFARVG